MRVHRTTYELRQRFHYHYSLPIANLRHRLVITPPALYGDQRLISRRTHISPADAIARTESTDDFGNRIIEVLAPRVEKSIWFDAKFVIERSRPHGLPRVNAELLRDRRFLEPTPLTHPNHVLRAIAGRLAADGGTGAELATRINAWVHQRMAYVLVPDATDPSAAVAHAYDPTHGRVAGLQYVTVALGRDYRDVAPTSGTYSAGGKGSLDTRKRVDVLRVDYAHRR